MKATLRPFYSDLGMYRAYVRVRKSLFSYGYPPVFRPLGLLYSLLLTRVGFAAWFHARRYWFRLSGVPLRTIAGGDCSASVHVTNDVVRHQFWQAARISRHRTERLVNVLTSIGGLDPRKAKVLSIGPRNETELLLLNAYGFPMRNLVGIDLFSYSPKIEVMDMHDMTFADNSFDVVYCAFTIRYSDAVDRLISEMVRVGRDGAYIALIFSTPDRRDTPGGRVGISQTKLWGGLDELYALLDRHVGDVVWRDSFNNSRFGENGRNVYSTIFRLRKPTEGQV